MQKYQYSFFEEAWQAVIDIYQQFQAEL